MQKQDLLTHYLSQDLGGRGGNLDESKANTATEAPESTQEATEGTNNKITLEELIKSDKTAQSELDRRISQAINTAKKKWDEEAKLTDEERAAKALQDREEMLASKEKAFALKERTTDAKKALIENRMPEVLADLIAKGTETSKEAQELIASLKTEWDKQLTEATKASARQAPAQAQQEAQLDKENPASLVEFAAKNRKVK